MVASVEHDLARTFDSKYFTLTTFRCCILMADEVVFIKTRWIFVSQLQINTVRTDVYINFRAMFYGDFGVYRKSVKQKFHSGRLSERLNDRLTNCPTRQHYTPIRGEDMKNHKQISKIKKMTHSARLIRTGKSNFCQN